ncbi:hypothetical protein FRC03_008509 [Tulasnella sp. 419]|nr:hypothetical protein FRC03_008509 [Tulasnella sp. 419]
MAPTYSRRWEKTEEAPSSGKMTIEPLYIVGIVVACALFMGGAAWWAYRYFKSKKESKEALNRSSMMFTSEKSGATPRPLPPNAFNRAKMTASIVLPKRADDQDAEDPSQFVKAYLPPIRPQSLRKMPSNSSLPSRQSHLRQSMLPGDQSDTSHLTAQDIVEYHKAEGNFPVSFAPFSISLGDYAPNEKGQHSAKGSLSSLKEGVRDSQGSLPSLGVIHGHKPKMSGSGHSRFSSLSASIRNSVASWNGSGLSPTKSTFTFGKKHQHSPSAVLGAGITQTTIAGSEQRIVKVTFSPLLPDELVVAVNEKVTVIESYDDGWCIVGRMNLGMLEVGAVPQFAFGPAYSEDTTRQMRSSSLGVTVDLRVVEEEMETGRKFGKVAPAGVRDSIISWSNF